MPILIVHVISFDITTSIITGQITGISKWVMPTKLPSIVTISPGSTDIRKKDNTYHREKQSGLIVVANLFVTVRLDNAENHAVLRMVTQKAYCES